MTLTDEEKIQKAEEIYYRRNGISYRGEKKEKSHWVRNTLFFLLMIIAVLGYNNKEYIMSEEFQNKAKTFLNTKIDIQKMIVPNNNHKTEEKKKTAAKEEKINQVIEEEKVKAEESTEETLTENIVNEEVPTAEPAAEEVSVENIQTYEIIWPYKGNITSKFGKRESEDARVTSNHTGIDIAGKQGDIIVSAIGGKVVKVSEEGDLRETYKN